ncbi:hypothetical protein [Deinococcus psychrotolerans]|nr:hypothetical protein [Deinococcus psychrotolerans]
MNNTLSARKVMIMALAGLMLSGAASAGLILPGNSGVLSAPHVGK